MLAVLCLAAPTAHGVPANGKSESGRITGVVLDSAGNPLSGMHIYASPIQGWPIVGRPPTVTTGIDGRFIIPSAKPGKNRIEAFDDQRGYTMPGLAFYSHSPGASPIVVVRSGEEADVVIRMNPPNGKIRFRIVDQDGRAVEAPIIKLCWSDKAGVCITTRASREGMMELFAPLAKVDIETQAAGYQSAIERRVGVESGQVLEKTITMKSEAKQ